jgi:FkbM family methyltransferase
MRLELFYNPRLLCERLADLSIKKRRLAKLRGTVADKLTIEHISALELLELVRPLKPAVVYDIGANVGTWSLLVKALFPQVQVQAFEPIEKHQIKFLENTRYLNNIQLHNIALGSEEGSAIVKITDFSDASSMLELSEEGKCRWNLNKVDEKKVQLSTLDSWVIKNQIPWPDIIKMDVQGYEIEVLKGSSQCLKHAKAVFSEVSFQEFYQRQALFHNLVTYMAEHGFKIYAFDHAITGGTRLFQADALFVSDRAYDFM